MFHVGARVVRRARALLAALRDEGIAIDELALEETDLEQVFLHDHAAASRGARREHERSSNAAHDASRRSRLGRRCFYKELLRFWKVSFQTIAAPVLTSLLYLLIFSHVLEGRVAVLRRPRDATRRSSCPAS